MFKSLDSSVEQRLEGGETRLASDSSSNQERYDKNVSQGTDARSVLEEESLEEGRRCQRTHRFLGKQNEWGF